MDSALSSSLSADTPHSSTEELPDATSWHVRIRQLLVIGFDEFDEFELDLGTPKDLDTYVCGLFERGPLVGSQRGPAAPTCLG